MPSAPGPVGLIRIDNDFHFRVFVQRDHTRPVVLKDDERVVSLMLVDMPRDFIGQSCVLMGVVLGHVWHFGSSANA